MTRLSVNINKIALIRNSRGANYPNLVKVAQDCEEFGAQGITVHPRPDERHIKYADIPILKDIVQQEFNVEGNPTQQFIDLVVKNKPHQVTLVPDAPDALTSDTGWDTIEYASFLKDVTQTFQAAGIRVSIFIDPVAKMIEGAKKTGVDRIEFYTGPYAHDFLKNKLKAVEPYSKTAKIANKLGLGINAGHDLNLNNLSFFKNNVEGLLEVSIGHALVTDSLYMGLQNTIQLYIKELQ